jgi:hypothetical protein
MSRKRQLKRKHRHFWRIKPELVRPLIFVVLFSIGGAILTYFSFAATTGTRPPTDPNPAVGQSCGGGLNIALVADTSNSIFAYRNDVTQLETALKNFIASLLPSTSSQFSLTGFNRNATVFQQFTNNINALNTAIDSLRGGDGTNWTAGLQAGYSTFSSAPSNVPKLLIIATDGDPTEPTSSTVALNNAIAEANTIKAAGIHILAIAIGGSPNINNLEAITGTNVDTGNVNTDVVRTDYARLSDALVSIAQATCGGGSGNGNGGTGTGTNGTGKGTGGTGTGTSGSGTGSKANPTPAPSPNPAPAAVPAPAPAPAPAPTAQGTQVQPPKPQPSPFFDGKQYAAGTITDNFTGTVKRPLTFNWWYVGGGIALLGAGAGGYIWWRRQKSSGKK